MDDLTRRQLEMERRVYRLEDLAEKELARSNAAMMAAEYLGTVLTLEWSYSGIAIPVCYRIYSPLVTTSSGSILTDCQQNATLLSGACDEYPEAPYYSAISFESYNTRLGEWVWICRGDWKYGGTDYFGNQICGGGIVWSYSSVVDGAVAGTSGVPAMPAPYAGYRYQVTLAPTRRVGYHVNAIFVNGQIKSGMYDGAAASNSIDSATGTITGINCYGGGFGQETTGNITAAPAPVKNWPAIPYPKSVTVSIVTVAAAAATLKPGQTARNQMANADAATIWTQIGGIVGGYGHTRATNSGPPRFPCEGGIMGTFPSDTSPDTKIGTFTPTFMGTGRCAVDVLGGKAGVQTAQGTTPLIDTIAVHMSGSLSRCLGAITKAEPEARLYVGNARTNPSFSIGLSSATAAGCDPIKFPNPDRTISLGSFGLSGFGGNIPATTAVEGEPISKEWTVTLKQSAGVSGDKYDEVDPQTGRTIQGECDLTITLKVKINCGI
jgi:hypothetical protein